MTWPELAVQAAVGTVPIVVAALAYKSATKANKTTTDAQDRAAFTDDLQQEITELRTVVRETRQEADRLRSRLRAAVDYLDRCMAVMRQAGVEPPPVPALVRYPWEDTNGHPRDP